MIREATRADLPRLVALEALTMGDDAWTPSQVEEELDRAGGIFLVDDAGMAIAWAVLGELHVLQVVVHPDHRRKGHARRLLAGLEAARRVEVSWLEVRADNDAAIGLYGVSGYAIVGRRPRYYADATDAIVMHKRIQNAGANR